MKINLNSVFVEDQRKALHFYTAILGFVKKRDMPVGEFSWLTVISPEGPDDVELLLEPNDNPIGRTFQEDIFAAGIPAASFGVEDVQKEYERLSELGVEFRQKPTEMGSATVAVFDDTCGNLIQIVQA